MELVMAFAEACDIPFPDQDVEKIPTVQDPIGYIRPHVKGAR